MFPLYLYIYTYTYQKWITLTILEVVPIHAFAKLESRWTWVYLKSRSREFAEAILHIGGLLCTLLLKSSSWSMFNMFHHTENNVWAAHGNHAAHHRTSSLGLCQAIQKSMETFKLNSCGTLICRSDYAERSPSADERVGIPPKVSCPAGKMVSVSIIYINILNYDARLDNMWVSRFSVCIHFRTPKLRRIF